MNKESSEGRRLFTAERRRMVVYALIGVIVLLSTVVTGLFINGRSGESRGEIVLLPRNLDIWAVYPDQTVRFVTLIEPDQAGKIISQVDAAGPLLLSADDIISDGIIGGTSAGTDLMSGAEYYDSSSGEVFYPVYWIDYPGRGYYGIDVFVEDSPYVAPDPADESGETLVLTLGTNLEEVYQQIIVAVALPKSARVVELSGLYPYRQVELGDWNILYYDTSAPSFGAMIRVAFILDPADDPADFNLAVVDKRR